MAFTAAEIAARWARRGGAVNPEVRRTVRQLGERVLAAGLRHMEADIYAKPVDRSGTGRPKWQRTGDLKRAERLEWAPDGAGFTLTNALDYAEPRHEAGKPGRRKTTRPAHWREEALAELRVAIPVALAGMNLRIMRAGE